MRQLSLAVLLLVILPLTACQTGMNNPSSRFYVPPVGTRVIVHKEIPIPLRWAHVYLQDGIVYAPGKYNAYYPNCFFEMENVSQGSEKIEPDTFEVYDRSWGPQDVLGARPTMVAGLSIGIGGSSGGAVFGQVDGGEVSQNYNVTLKLRSERQPGVMSLTCNAGQDDASQVKQPTIEQMRKSLGSYASLELPAAPVKK